MALRSCRECGGAVSTTARVCPHCGAIQSSITGCAGCLIVIVILVIIGICGGIFAEMGGILHSPPATTIHAR